MKRKFLIGLSCAALCLGLFLGQSQAEAAEARARLQAWEPIAPGVIQEDYIWYTGYGPVKIAALKCDLTNPDLDLQVVAGAGKYTKRATVSQMAQRTDAVAMLNGDYFNMALEGSPIGPSYVDGKLQSSPCVISGLYSLGINADDRAEILPIYFKGYVEAPNGKGFPIDGLNKTNYWHSPSGAESHTGTIQVYNDFWASASRGHKTNSELLLDANGRVETISYGKRLGYAVPKDKLVLQFSGKAEKFIQENVQEGDQLIVNYGIEPDKNWQFLIGGHALVLDNGQVTNYTKDINVLGGVRARTAAGVSADGKTLYLVCAEGRTYQSAGLTLSSLGNFMKQMGMSRAVNLDGGGSTTMVAQGLGSFDRTRLINPESYYAERAVVNGIGVFNRTPVGPIDGMMIGGPNELLIGETGTYYIHKAWDKNYHPKETDVATTNTDSANLGKWGGKWFLAFEKGETNIVLTTEDGVAGEKPIRILGGEGIQRLTLTGDEMYLPLGQTTNFQVQAKPYNRDETRLSPKVGDYYLAGAEGSINQNKGEVTIDEYYGPFAGLHLNLDGKEARKLFVNPAADMLEMAIGHNEYYINNLGYDLDSAPVIKDNRTLVPIRFIGEAIEAEVEWDGDTREVTIQDDGMDIVLTIGSKQALINGENVMLDVPPQIVQGRTMMPLRFVAENLGYAVEYEKGNIFIAIEKTG